MLGLVRLALKSDLPVLRFHQMALQTIRRNSVRNQPHAMRVRGVDLDRPGLPVWLEGRSFRIAPVKRRYRKMTLGREPEVGLGEAPTGRRRRHRDLLEGRLGTTSGTSPTWRL